MIEAVAEFPEHYRELLSEHFRPYRFLDGDERARLEKYILRFLEKKTFHSIPSRDEQGNSVPFEVTEEMRLIIAACACLLITNRGHREPYPSVANLYVCEDSFMPKENPVNAETGLPMMEVRDGEAWHNGPMAFSWNAIAEAITEPDDGSWISENVVMHEFAHILDQADGGFDGTPDLGPDGDYEEWKEIMEEEFLELRELVSTEEGKAESDIDPYAAENEAEFFAVVTEYFFTDGAYLEENHPDLFDLMHEFYRIDPRRWAPEG